MKGMEVIVGRGLGKPNQVPSEAIEGAVHEAVLQGYTIGRRVTIGEIPGQIVGYNIAALGRYDGYHYPLVVETGFGIAKCHPDELRPLGPAAGGAKGF